MARMHWDQLNRILFDFVALIMPATLFDTSEHCVLVNLEGRHQSTSLWSQGSWRCWWKYFDNGNTFTPAAQTGCRLYSLSFGWLWGRCKNYSVHTDEAKVKLHICLNSRANWGWTLTLSAHIVKCWPHGTRETHGKCAANSDKTSGAFFTVSRVRTQDLNLCLRVLALGVAGL